MVGHEKGENIRIKVIFSDFFIRPHYFNLLIKKDPVTVVGNWVSMYKDGIDRDF